MKSFPKEFKPGLIVWSSLSGRDKQIYVLISQSVEHDSEGEKVLLWTLFASDGLYENFRITRENAEEFYSRICELS